MPKGVARDGASRILRPLIPCGREPGWCSKTNRSESLINVVTFDKPKELTSASSQAWAKRQVDKDECFPITHRR